MNNKNKTQLELQLFVRCSILDYVQTPDVDDQFRKINLSTKSGSRHDLVAVTISPAVLNTLSLEMDVPGILCNDIATAESRRNVYCIRTVSLPFQRVLCYWNTLTSVLSNLFAGSIMYIGSLKPHKRP